MVNLQSTEKLQRESATSKLINLMSWGPERPKGREGSNQDALLQVAREIVPRPKCGEIITALWEERLGNIEKYNTKLATIARDVSPTPDVIYYPDNPSYIMWAGELIAGLLARSLKINAPHQTETVYRNLVTAAVEAVAPIGINIEPNIHHPPHDITEIRVGLIGSGGVGLRDEITSGNVQQAIIDWTRLGLTRSLLDLQEQIHRIPSTLKEWASYQREQREGRGMVDSTTFVNREIAPDILGVLTDRVLIGKSKSND